MPQPVVYVEQQHADAGMRVEPPDARGQPVGAPALLGDLRQQEHRYAWIGEQFAQRRRAKHMIADPVGGDDVLHRAGHHDVVQPAEIAGQQDAQDRAAAVGQRAGVIGKPAADQDRRRFRRPGAQQRRVAPGKPHRRLHEGGPQSAAAEQQIFGRAGGKTRVLQTGRLAAARLAVP